MAEQKGQNKRIASPKNTILGGSGAVFHQPQSLQPHPPLLDGNFIAGYQHGYNLAVSVYQNARGIPQPPILNQPMRPFYQPHTSPAWSQQSTVHSPYQPHHVLPPRYLRPGRRLPRLIESKSIQPTSSAYPKAARSPDPAGGQGVRSKPPQAEKSGRFNPQSKPDPQGPSQSVPPDTQYETREHPTSSSLPQPRPESQPVAQVSLPVSGAQSHFMEAQAQIVRAAFQVHPTQLSPPAQPVQYQAQARPPPFAPGRLCLPDKLPLLQYDSSREDVSSSTDANRNSSSATDLSPKPQTEQPLQSKAFVPFALENPSKLSFADRPCDILGVSIAATPQE